MLCNSLLLDKTFHLGGNYQDPDVPNGGETLHQMGAVELRRKSPGPQEASKRRQWNRPLPCQAH